MSNELQIKRLQSRITSINNVLSDSIESKVLVLTNKINELTILETSLSQSVADLNGQITTLNTTIEDTKAESHYVFQHTGECEGKLTTHNVLLPLAYGSGAANEINFALFIPFKCKMDRIAMTSVFGENERNNPGLQVRIEVVYNGVTMLSGVFPESWSTGTQRYHHGVSNEISHMDIQHAGSFIYVYSHASNLLDDSARHRITFYFKKNYFDN